MNKTQQAIIVGLTTVVAALALVLSVGLAQNYLSNAHRGCVRYDASTDYWGYQCAGTGFYEAK